MAKTKQSARASYDQLLVKIEELTKENALLRKSQKGLQERIRQEASRLNMICACLHSIKADPLCVERWSILEELLKRFQEEVSDVVSNLPLPDHCYWDD